MYNSLLDDFIRRFTINNKSALEEVEDDRTRPIRLDGLYDIMVELEEKIEDAKQWKYNTLNSKLFISSQPYVFWLLIGFSMRTEHPVLMGKYTIDKRS